jgi:hypothetical protein
MLLGDIYGHSIPEAQAEARASRMRYKRRGIRT